MWMTSHARSEDVVKIIGIKVCDSHEDSIRSCAAALMDAMPGTNYYNEVKLVVHQHSIQFIPAVTFSGINSSQILLSDVIGFFLARKYKTKMVIALYGDAPEKVQLYGLMMSNPTKITELSSLLSASTRSCVLSTKEYELNAPNTNAARPQSKKLSISVLNNQNTPSNAVNQLQAKDCLVSRDENSSLAVLSTRLFSKQQPADDFPVFGAYRSNAYISNMQTMIKCATEGSNAKPILSQDSASESDDAVSIGYYNDDAGFEEVEYPQTLRAERKIPVSEIAPQDLWMENITYISNDPKGGSQVTSDGSVYMYVAQQVTAKTQRQICR